MVEEDTATTTKDESFDELWEGESHYDAAAYDYEISDGSEPITTDPDKMPPPITKHEYERAEKRQKGLLGAKEPIGYCPSCGRKIGERKECPYCMTGIEGRVSEKWIVVSLLPMLVIGIVFLLLSSSYVTPLTHLDEVSESDGFRTIRVHGWVVDTSYHKTINKDFGVYRMYIAEEDTNEDGVIDRFDHSFYVKARFHVTEVLKERDNFPVVGDEVYLEGVVYWFPTFEMMEVRNPDRVEIVEPDYTEVPIDTLLNASRSDFKTGDKVRVTGTLAADPDLSDWLSKLQLGSTRSGRTIDVPFWSTTVLLTDDNFTNDKEENFPPYEEWYLHRFGYLDRVEVTGYLSWYRDAWQINPRSVEAVTLLEPAPTTYTPVENFTKVQDNPVDYIYQRLALRHLTVNWSYRYNTDIFSLFAVYQDNISREMSVVARDLEPLKNLAEGQVVDLYGTVMNYDGEWEVYLEGKRGDHAVIHSGDAIDYQNVTIAALYANPNEYLGDHLRFTDVECTWVWSGTEDDYGLFRFGQGNPDEELFTIVSDFDTVEFDLSAVVVGNHYTITGRFTNYEHSEQYGWTYEFSMNAKAGASFIDLTGPVEYTSMTLDTLLDDTAQYDGTFVEVDATVDSIAWFEDSALFYITDQSTTQTFMVYADYDTNLPASLEEGDSVTIRGRIGSYQGDWQINIRSNSDDAVLATRSDADPDSPPPTDASHDTEVNL